MSEEESLEVASELFTSSFADHARVPSTDTELLKRTKKGSSVFKAMYNVICAVAGIGVLGLPYSISLAGWGGIALLLILGGVAAYTGIILSYCFVQDPNLESYSDLGMKAFGKWGKYAVHLAQIGTCLGTSILFLVLSGKNIDRVASTWGCHMGTTFWIGMSTLAVLPLCYLKTLHDIGWVTFAGMVGCIVAVVIIIILVFYTPVSMRNHDYSGQGFQGLLQAFATITFAYGGHVIYPNIIRSMNYPHHFPRAVYLSSTTILILYIPVTVIGYWQFGSRTQSNILDNLPQNAASAVITFSLTAHVLFAYVLYLHPFFHIIERKLGLLQGESRAWRPSASQFLSKISKEERSHRITKGNLDELRETKSAQLADIPQAMQLPSHISLENIRPDYLIHEKISQKDPSLKLDITENWFNRFLKKLSSTVLVIILRTLIVGLTMFIAMLIPFFGDLMDFIGGSTQAMSIFILPCFIYVRIYWKQLSWFVIGINLVLATLGMIAGGIASVFALIHIIQKASTYRVFAGS